MSSCLVSVMSGCIIDVVISMFGLFVVPCRVVVVVMSDGIVGIAVVCVVTGVIVRLCVVGV